MRKASALVIVALLSGCATKDPVVLEETTLTLLTVDAQTGEELFLKPNLTAGRWWQARLAIDYGNGFILDFEGKVVVTDAPGGGFRLGADNKDFGILDTYFDSFYHGALDGDLNPRIGEDHVRFFQWPLKTGQTWTTKLPAQGFDGFTGRIDEVRMNVTEFEEDRSPYAPRLRVQGETAWGEKIDFDYSAATGWMTYFRMTNLTTGRVIVSLDFKATGTGFAGDVHHILQEPLLETFRMTPPFNPSMAPAPERVNVPEGYAFVDEIKFLFTYPLSALDVTLGGGGEVGVVIGLPNGTTHRTLHTGAGNTFQSFFERTEVHGQVSGAWTVEVLPGGTGGAFVGLYGFKDDVKKLAA